MNPRAIAAISELHRVCECQSRRGTPLLDPSIAADPAIFPPPDVQERLFVETMDDPEQLRLMTRIWQRFKTAQ